MAGILQDAWFNSDTSSVYAAIGNSLRFRGAATLSRAVAGSGTISVWVKRGKLGTAQTIAPNVVFAAGDTLNGSTAVFRDPSAWMHIVANNGNTWVNNQRVSGGTAPTSGTLGTSFEGYMAEVHFVDGLALDASSFGEFNADGVWVPKKVPGVTYGTNGFYLDFSDPANIGADRSGNGNNFTATGFDLTGVTLNDYFRAEDTHNVWNMLAKLTNSNVIGPSIDFHKVSTGNVVANGIYGGWRVFGTETILPRSGKYYIELTSQFNLTYGYSSSNRLSFGLVPNDATATYSINDAAGTLSLMREHGTFPSGLGKNTAKIYNRQTNTNENIDVTGSYADDGEDNRRSRTVFYMDMDNGKAWIGVPRWDGTSTTYTAGADPTNPATGQLSFTPGTEFILYLRIAAGDWQGGIGQNQFVWTQGSLPTAHPDGYEALVPSKLPDVAIPNPSRHFTTILDTGANILTAAQAKFPNGLWWIKDRANSNQHQLVDSVSGTGVVRQCPANADAAYAAPAGNSVAWCWATPASGINTTAGFSITSGTHGLGVTPALVIDRQLNVWHQSLTAGQGLKLFDTASAAAQTWTVDATTATGPGGGPYWTWAGVSGYSAFGSYTGNGSADGPFAYCEFLPAFVLIKCSSTTGSWEIYDNLRNTYNPETLALQSNLTSAESTISGIDFVSNGFKIRTTDANLNTSGQTYIYAAFAEHPFGGNNVAPVTAR